MASMNPADNDYRTNPGEIKIGAGRSNGVRDHRVMPQSDSVPMLHQGLGGAKGQGATTSERMRSTAVRTGMAAPRTVASGGRSGGRGGAQNFGAVRNRGK